MNKKRLTQPRIPVRQITQAATVDFEHLLPDALIGVRGAARILAAVARRVALEAPARIAETDSATSAVAPEGKEAADA